MAGSLEEAQGWLHRAEETLAAATALLDAGFYREATSRAYYAMFYAARAALALEGIHVHKHSAVISAFGRRLANARRVSQHLHRTLLVAFEDRGDADYELAWEPTRENAERRLSEAKEFVSEIGRFLARP